MSRTGRVGVLGRLHMIPCLTPPAPAAAQGCPELVGRWPYGTAMTTTIFGDFAYLSSGTSLLVMDISSPAAPVLLGDVTSPETVYGDGFEALGLMAWTAVLP